MKKVRVQRERSFCPHHILLDVAYTALKHAESKPHGWFHYEIMAIIFSALALEAMANAFGEKLISRWEDIERASPIRKLRVVCTNLKIEAQFDQEPWFTARWLVSFRNEVAHARPEPVKEEKMVTDEQYEQMRLERPASKIEAQVTLANAKRSFAAVSQIGYILCEKLSPKDIEGLLADGWTSRATHIPDDNQ